MSFAELAGSSQTDPRRAALLLHAMAPADREWLLERLPAPAGQALRGLLAELSQLGIPPDTGVLDSVLLAPRTLEAATAPGSAPAAAPSSPSLSGALADAAFLMALDPGDIDALARAWHGQPTWLVVRGLCVRPWPWRPLALEKLPLPQRRRVIDQMESMSLRAPGDNAMAGALLASMRSCCEQARAAARVAATPVPARRAPRLPRWLRRGL
jgi:hypothetical protein